MKIIGICGPSGSGKTTLAKMLVKELRGTLIGIDDYFIPDPPVKKYNEIGKNWELPENIDWSAVRTVVQALRRGQVAEGRKMDWDSKTYATKSIEPNKLIVVEGFLLLHDTQLSSLLDLTVYIDVPDEVGIARRLKREGTKNNEKWFREVTFPEYKARRKVFKERADLVLDGTESIEDNFLTFKSKI